MKTKYLVCPLLHSDIICPGHHRSPPIGHLDILMRPRRTFTLVITIGDHDLPGACDASSGLRLGLFCLNPQNTIIAVVAAGVGGIVPAPAGAGRDVGVELAHVVGLEVLVGGVGGGLARAAQVLEEDAE